jgi:hypothetical protein
VIKNVVCWPLADMGECIATSAFGRKADMAYTLQMSAFGGKADIR